VKRFLQHLDRLREVARFVPETGSVWSPPWGQGGLPGFHPPTSINRFLSYLLLLALILAAPLHAKTRFAGIFGEQMVLQQEQPVPVWGWAEPGEKVTVTFAGQQKAATADADGKWMVKLDKLRANAEASPLTAAAAETVTITNVVVGEVWLCGGQSNMGLALSDCFNATEEIAAANDPQFRFAAVGSGGSVVPAPDIAPAKWRVSTPETAASFAGTAYFFGRALRRELKVPVGLIEFDRGATGIEGWVPLEGYRLCKEPVLQEMYRQAASWNPKSEIGKKAHEETFQKIEAWIPQAKAALAEKKPVPPEPLVPAPLGPMPGPTETFNGTIHPLVPFAIRGAVWYQGESNPGEKLIYELKLRAMIIGWRAVWGQGDFPVYVVQLANEGNIVTEPDEEINFRYVPVRDAQRRAVALPNTGLVVAIDLGEDANGHPRNKRDVGERAALWARAKLYGQKVPYSGPLYRSCKRDGDRMIISFDYADSGLMVADKDGLNPVKEVPEGVMKQFSVQGADGKWHWAEAKIEGKTVVVRSDKVPAPAAVRYAYSLNPKGPKLYNRDGLPASPFSTEKW
jgi:sialate O-acetylesterase